MPIFTSALLLGALLITPGVGIAGPPNPKVKEAKAEFTPTNPATATAGSNFTGTIRVTNCSQDAPRCAQPSTIALGSSQSTVPSEFTVDPTSISAAAPAGKSWTASLITVSGKPTIQALASGGTSKLAAGESVDITFTAAVASCAAVTREFTTKARGSTDFSPGEDFHMNSQPSASISAANVATHARITDIDDPSGAPWLSSGSPFVVSVETLNDQDQVAAPCGTMEVTLTKVSGTGTLAGSPSLSTQITAPATTGTITAKYTATGSAGENNVTFRVTPTRALDNHLVSIHDVSVDFAGQTVTNVDQFQLPPLGGSPTPSSTSSTSSTPSCAVTSSHPICVVWVLPNGSTPDGGEKTTVYGGLLTCTGADDCRGGIFVKIQAIGDAIDSMYDNVDESGDTVPNEYYLMYFFCHKTACPGGGVTNYKLFTKPTPASAPTELPACTPSVKDRVHPWPNDASACTDYVASNRSPSPENALMLVGRFAVPLSVDPPGWGR